MNAVPGRDSVQVADLRFPHFDAFAEAVAGWSVDFRQLDAGEAPAELTQIEAPGILFSRSRFGRAYDQRGESPAEMCTVGLLEKGVSGVTWCAEPMSETDFSVFPVGGAFEASSEPGFGCWTVSVSSELLARRADELGRPDLFERAGNGGVRPGDPGALESLRVTLGLLARGASGNSSEPFVDAVNRSVPEGVLGLFSHTLEQPGRPPTRLRDRAFAGARAYVLDCGAAPPTVTGMREASGASWRTLDYAFRERLGVTPQAYLKAVRLDSFRKALLSAPDSSRIVEVATQHGFWHMGQLAADYRAQFGELPSKTRARSQGPE